MERLIHMRLKKAYFYLVMLFLLIALIMSTFSILGIGKILNTYGPSVVVNINNSVISPTVINTADTLPLWYHILEIMQIVLPILFFTIGFLLSDILFYNIKIKKPLAELQFSSQLIMQNNLDFTIQFESNDEFGQLCHVFEEMRLALLKNNKELWRQAEERKRLNAAFSHNLRNPVTVLKGSSKILKKALISNNISDQSAKDSILLIEEYSERIETYIKAMSRIQSLEEIQFSPKYINSETLMKELLTSVRLITMDTCISIENQFERLPEKIWIDKAIIYIIIENLVINASRYAKSKIYFGISLSADAQMLTLTVKDDGPGFPRLILQKGATPFLRGKSENDDGFHFGIGLYVSHLLCEKHNGLLSLENALSGAVVMASIKITKLE